MPFTREIVLDADPAVAYDALRTVVQPNVDIGSFEVTIDEPPDDYGIAYLNPLSSSHYRFHFEPVSEGTRVEARLWLGGLLGPMQSLFRFRSHGKHLDQLLVWVEKKTIAALDPTRDGPNSSASRAAEIPPPAGLTSPPDDA